MLAYISVRLGVVNHHARKNGNDVNVLKLCQDYVMDCKYAYIQYKN